MLRRNKSMAMLMLSSILMLPAATASAQGFSFGFHFGDERKDFAPSLGMCLTDRQIRNAIGDRGYTNIYLNIPHDGRVQVRATRGPWVYLIEFDYCRNRIDGISRLRRAG